MKKIYFTILCLGIGFGVQPVLAQTMDMATMMKMMSIMGDEQAMQDFESEMGDPEAAALEMQKTFGIPDSEMPDMSDWGTGASDSTSPTTVYEPLSLTTEINLNEIEEAKALEEALVEEEEAFEDEENELRELEREIHTRRVALNAKKTALKQLKRDWWKLSFAEKKEQWKAFQEERYEIKQDIREERQDIREDRQNSLEERKLSFQEKKTETVDRWQAAKKDVLTQWQTRKEDSIEYQEMKQEEQKANREALREKLKSQKMSIQERIKARNEDWNAKKTELLNYEWRLKNSLDSEKSGYDKLRYNNDSNNDRRTFFKRAMDFSSPYAKKSNTKATTPTEPIGEMDEE